MAISFWSLSWNIIGTKQTNIRFLPNLLSNSNLASSFEEFPSSNLYDLRKLCSQGIFYGYLFRVFWKKLYNVVLPLEFIDKIVRQDFSLIKVLICDDLIYRSLIFFEAFIFCFNSFYSTFILEWHKYALQWRLNIPGLLLCLIFISIIFILLIHVLCNINSIHLWMTNPMRIFLDPQIK